MTPRNHRIGSYKKGSEVTPLEFNSSPLKNDGWKTILSYWVYITFQRQTDKLQWGRLSVSACALTLSVSNMAFRTTGVTEAKHSHVFFHPFPTGCKSVDFRGHFRFGNLVGGQIGKHYPTFRAQKR